MAKHSCMLSYVCVFALLLPVACSIIYPRVDSQGQPQYEYVYQMPQETGDGWETSSLHSEGVDLERVNELIRNILNRRFENIHSVLLDPVLSACSAYPTRIEAILDEILWLCKLRKKGAYRVQIKEKFQHFEKFVCNNIK